MSNGKSRMRTKFQQIGTVIHIDGQLIDEIFSDFRSFGTNSCHQKRFCVLDKREREIELLSHVRIEMNSARNECSYPCHIWIDVIDWIEEFFQSVDRAIFRGFEKLLERCSPLRGRLTGWPSPYFHLFWGENGRFDVGLSRGIDLLRVTHGKESGSKYVRVISSFRSLAYRWLRLMLFSDHSNFAFFIGQRGQMPLACLVQKRKHSNRCPF